MMEIKNSKYMIDPPTGISLFDAIIIRNRENSPFQFSYDGPCATFSLVAYCSSDDSNYGVSCSSSFVITGATLPVTTSVSRVQVSAIPSVVPSTTQPSQGSTSLSCPFYNGFNISLLIYLHSFIHSFFSSY